MYCSLCFSFYKGWEPEPQGAGWFWPLGSRLEKTRVRAAPQKNKETEPHIFAPAPAQAPGRQENCTCYFSVVVGGGIFC